MSENDLFRFLFTLAALIYAGGVLGLNLFHPELRSRPGRPHPLFLGFIRSVLDAAAAPLRGAAGATETEAALAGAPAAAE